ncbi:MAG: ABC transporter ATP-binding protein [Myxococcota bacterium]
MSSFDQVTCKQVGRAFGRVRALARVDLRLRAGTLTGLVGPNGAGKSTLLGVLSTLLSPSNGEVLYGSYSHREAARELRGCIGLVSHQASVYPDLSALENLHFWARLHELPGEEAGRMLELVGLAEETWRRPAGTYSRGMLQKLSLARALLHDPRLLLLDEPFTGLDPEAVDRLVDLLDSARRSGKLVLLVTHDIEQAARVSDEVAILVRGRIRRLIEEKLTAPQLLSAYREARSGEAAPA